MNEDMPCLERQRLAEQYDVALDLYESAFEALRGLEGEAYDSAYAGACKILQVWNASYDALTGHDRRHECWG